MYGLIFAVLPFLPMVACTVLAFALIHIGEGKPKVERTMMFFQVIVWLLFGVSTTVLIYSIIGIQDDLPWNIDWDVVTNVSFFTCLALPIISFVIFCLKISYRRNHPDEYTKDCRDIAVMVFKVPADNDENHDDGQNAEEHHDETPMTDQVDPTTNQASENGGVPTGNT